MAGTSSWAAEAAAKVTEASAKARWTAWAEATAAGWAATGWAASSADRASASRWYAVTAAVVTAGVSAVVTAVVGVSWAAVVAVRRAFGAGTARADGPRVALAPRVCSLELVPELLSLEHEAGERLAESRAAAAGLRLKPRRVVS